MSLLRSPWLRSCAVAAVTVITGSGNLPQSPQVQSAPQAAGCPFGYYSANGVCYPYSWSARGTVSGQNGVELPP